LGALEALGKESREGLRSILTNEELGLNEAELPGYRPVVAVLQRRPSIIEPGGLEGGGLFRGF